MTNKTQRNALAAQPTPDVVPATDKPGQQDRSLAAPQDKPPSKSAQVIALLEAGDGATVADLCAATGWQSNSCRAFFTSLRKKGRVLERSHRADGASVYKLVAASGAMQ